jgi:hypothetical protein
MVVVILGVPIATSAQTQTLTLAWDSTSQPIDHYNVYIGTQPGAHNVGVQSVPGIQPAYSFTVTPGTLLFFAVSAVDVDGVESQLSAELKCAVPILVQPSNQTGTAGVAIAPLVLTASDPGGGQLQFTAAGLPAGLVINGATGVISGTPSTAGTRTVTVSVDNGVVTTARSFSWTIAPAPVGAAVTFSVTPNSGSGATGTFTAQYTDSLGAAGLATVYLKFSAAVSGAASSCTLSYRPSTNQLSLRDDSGAVWQSAPIGWGTLQNSQCSVDLTATSASASGQTLRVVVAVAFTSAYAGTKNIYSYATTASGVETGWKTVGSWMIPASSTSTPVVNTIAVTPSDGFGATQTFAAQFMASGGAANIATAYIRFSESSTGTTNTCIVRYDRAAGLLSLRDDAGVWQPGSAPGSPGIQQNTQCSLSLTGSSTATSGEVLTVSVTMTFSSAYGGTKKVFLYASTLGGVTAGWKQHGSWTVPSGGDGSIGAGSVTPASGMGTAQVFSAQYIDAPNGDYVTLAYLKFSIVSNGPANTCMVRYDRLGKLLSLRDDAGQWLPNVPFAAGVSQENSQCTVSMASSSASVTGSVLTLNLAVTFKPSYAGPKNTYLSAESESGDFTDWQQRGSWTIPSSGPGAIVRIGEVSPNSGSGSAQVFSAGVIDMLGAGDLSIVYLTIGAAPTGTTNTCMIRYVPASGMVSLRDDAGAWMPGMAVTAAAQQQNSQCSVSVGPASVAVSGNVLRLTVTIEFQPAYQGSKNIFVFASTVGGYVTDWQPRGTWLVP